MYHSHCAVLYGFAIACALSARAVLAQPPAAALSPAGPKQQPPAATGDAALPAIRAASESFVAAFIQGDTKGVAVHWTADGDYTDECPR